MSAPPRLLRRALLPSGVFAAVLALHFLWLVFFPERNPAQEAWAALPDETTASSVSQYLDAQSYWFGYSYALSLAFAASALRRYLRRRSGAAGRFAVAGLTFTGVLSFAGCFLFGCCGSPMLVFWANILGTRLLPLAKPLVAAGATVSIAAGWLWMARSTPRPVRLNLGPIPPAEHDRPPR